MSAKSDESNEIYIFLEDLASCLLMSAGLRILAYHRIMTSSNGNNFCVTGHLCGKFTGPGDFPAQRLVTRSFDVFFDLRLNKQLSKQSYGWWFETLSRPLWHHCNGFGTFLKPSPSTWLCVFRVASALLLHGFPVIWTIPDSFPISYMLDRR